MTDAGPGPHGPAGCGLPPGDGKSLDLRRVLVMLSDVMERMTVDTEMGRVLTPGPTYHGFWARDTGVAALGLNRLGKSDLAGELLRRYWAYQITAESDPAMFVFRNKRFAEWTDSDAFRPARWQVLGEIGGFPTCVYTSAPGFPPGTREIYGLRADLDSVAWLIVALEDYGKHSGATDLLRTLAPQVGLAVDYLCSRDADGDHLLEQGANEDWADTLLRRGKVSYTQAVWYRSLQAAERIFTAVGNTRRAAFCRQEQGLVREAINRVLLDERGFYLNYRDGETVSRRRSLDTALLVAFGVADPATARTVIHTLSRLDGPFGPAVIEPGFAPSATGPSKYPPGQYQNEGIWPWIASYFALALATVGEEERARRVICSCLGPNPHTVHEWIDNLDGEPHHPDFATGAGALAWAITEGGLV